MYEKVQLLSVRVCNRSVITMFLIYLYIAAFPSVYSFNKGIVAPIWQWFPYGWNCVIFARPRKISPVTPFANGDFVVAFAGAGHVLIRLARRLGLGLITQGWNRAESVGKVSIRPVSIYSSGSITVCSVPAYPVRLVTCPVENYRNLPFQFAKGWSHVECAGSRKAKFSIAFASGDGVVVYAYANCVRAWLKCWKRAVFARWTSMKSAILKVSGIDLIHLVSANPVWIHTIISWIQNEPTLCQNLGDVSRLRRKWRSGRVVLRQWKKPGS